MLELDTQRVVEDILVVGSNLGSFIELTCQLSHGFSPIS
jgi:hypothetical protein